MRCENLSSFIYCIQHNFTIDSILLYCIIPGYAITYFTLQAKTSSKMQRKTESILLRYTYFQTETAVFHAINKLTVTHLEGVTLVI